MRAPIPRLRPAPYGCPLTSSHNPCSQGMSMLRRPGQMNERSTRPRWHRECSGRKSCQIEKNPPTCSFRAKMPWSKTPWSETHRGGGARWERRAIGSARRKLDRPMAKRIGGLCGGPGKPRDVARVDDVVGKRGANVAARAAGRLRGIWGE